MKLSRHTQRVALGFTKGVTPCHATLTEPCAPSAGVRWRRRWAPRVAPKARISITSLSTARRCAPARMATAMRRMCCRRFARVCNPFSAMRPRAASAWRFLMHCSFWTSSICSTKSSPATRCSVKNRSWCRSPRKAAATYFRSRTISRTYRRISQRLSTSLFFPLVSFDFIYTTLDQSPYAEIEFRLSKSEIRNPDGSMVFSLDEVEVPLDWSQVATDILAQKYFRRAGVPARVRRVEEDGVPSFLWRSEADTAALAALPAAARYGSEHSAVQVFDRLVGAWTYWGWKHHYFDGVDDAQAFFDELRFMLARQIAAPNSPQWFNTGLHWAYGIDCPSKGHYYVEPETNTVVESTSSYERPQPHACFIQSVSDDLLNDGGIMDLWMREARLFKYGSGTGTNFSKLRGENEKLSNGGKSSGLLSFLKIGDRAASAIKSGGTTRRAAKMVILEADHPDVEDFIDWKVKEEQKVAALVTGSKIIKKALKAIIDACVNSDGPVEDCFDPAANPALKKQIRLARRLYVPDAVITRVIQLARQGQTAINFAEFTTDWDSEAYLTVSGQNSNNTIRVTDDFLRAVETDGDWALTARLDGSPVKVMKARDLWHKIGRAAWACADPGLQFHTTINDWHTCPAAGPIVASNPCSEYMFLDDTACNLASLNLLKFESKNSDPFDFEAFSHAVRLWTLVLDISVTMAQFPSKEIARRSYDYRTLGLGYANLGGLLMSSGIAYDSDQGRALCAAISAMMTAEAYFTSAQMARDLGSFEGHPANAKAMRGVLANHARAACGEDSGYHNLSTLPVPLDIKAFGTSTIPERIKAAWERALAMGDWHGYRNAQVSAIAPTGTIGLLMDCDTTGIEPDFALVKFKRLAGGGYFKIINRAVPAGLRALGYTQPQIDDIITYAVGHASFRGRPPHQSRKPPRQRIHQDEDRRNRGQAAGRLRHQIRFQQMDAWR